MASFLRDSKLDTCSARAAVSAESRFCNSSSSDWRDCRMTSRAARGKTVQQGQQQMEQEPAEPARWSTLRHGKGKKPHHIGSEATCCLNPSIVQPPGKLLCKVDFAPGWCSCSWTWVTNDQAAVQSSEHPVSCCLSRGRFSMQSPRPADAAQALTCSSIVLLSSTDCAASTAASLPASAASLAAWLLAATCHSSSSNVADWWLPHSCSCSNAMQPKPCHRVLLCRFIKHVLARVRPSWAAVSPLSLQQHLLAA